MVQSPLLLYSLQGEEPAAKERRGVITAKKS